MKINTVDEALEAIRAGEMIVVVDDEGREHEGDLVMAAEHARPEAVNFMVTHGRGLLCAPVSSAIARNLGCTLMTGENNEPLKTAFTVSVDHRDVITGISAFERSRTLMHLADPEAKADDFTRPGHIFPLIAQDGGVLIRRGHTEAAVDLARLAGCAPAAAICEILHPDGTMARRNDLEDFAAHHHLKLITVEALSAHRKSASAADSKSAAAGGREAAPEYAAVTRDSEVNFPTAFGSFRLLTYITAKPDESARLDGSVGPAETAGFRQPKHHHEHHIALVKGHPETSTEPVLVRLHSECLTGDVFHSLRCDCGSQLHESLKQLQKADTGVLIYLRQEGRGIGLPGKMQAYMLQERGYDTVDANVALGFAPDERSYTAAADILKDLEVPKVRLMTNNPEKIAGLQECGIMVTERVPLIISPNETNRDYLRTKAARMGHLMTAF